MWVTLVIALNAQSQKVAGFSKPADQARNYKERATYRSAACERRRQKRTPSSAMAFAESVKTV
jgi:hypothetical protein